MVLSLTVVVAIYHFFLRQPQDLTYITPQHVFARWPSAFTLRLAGDLQSGRCFRRSSLKDRRGRGFTNWLSNFVVRTFSILLPYGGLVLRLLMYAMMGVLPFLFVDALATETKGRSLEEIETALR